MVKKLVWADILSVGIDEIDEDHRRLLDLFNLLHDAAKSGADPLYLEAVLTELINCTVWHFSHEERLMLNYHYPGFEEHKAEHRALIDSAKELQRKIVQAGNQVVDEDLVYLERWLTEHILSTDMPLGTHLADAM